MVRHLKEAKPKSLKLFTSRGSIYCMGVADKLQSFERGQCCEKHQYLKSDYYLLHTLHRQHVMLFEDDRLYKSLCKSQWSYNMVDILV